MRLHGHLGRPRGAWSLIELLIVLFILGIILGLLGIALHRANMASLRVQAQNNLKQDCLGSIQREAEEGLIWRPRDELHCPLTDEPYAISYYLYGKPASILPSSTTALFQEGALLDSKGQLLVAYIFLSPYRYHGGKDTDAVDAHNVFCTQFRWQGRCNVGWLDGHVTSEGMARRGIYHSPSFNYGVWYTASHKYNLGWPFPHGWEYTGSAN